MACFNAYSLDFCLVLVAFRATLIWIRDVELASLPKRAAKQAGRRTVGRTKRRADSQTMQAEVKTVRQAVGRTASGTNLKQIKRKRAA